MQGVVNSNLAAPAILLSVTSMEQPQKQLIYWDKHRIPFNFTVIFALGVAVFGIFQWAPVLIFAGLGIGAYSWLTNPRQYRVYPDALMIYFGTPRRRVIPFGEISHLEMRQMNTPDRLLVWLINGRRVSLVVRGPEAFQEQLQKALDEFKQQNPELSIADQSAGDVSQSPADQSAGDVAQSPGPSDQPPDFT